MTITNKDIKQWEPLLFKIVNRYSSDNLTIEDREDITQAAYLGLYKAINTYKPDSNIPFANYAGICITRTIQRELNKLRYNFNVGLLDNIECIGDDTTNKVDKQIYNTDMVIKVFKAIRRLNIDIVNKKILALKVIGYSNPEIANKLNLKKSQVCDSIHRHKQKLINKFQGGN